MNTLLRRLPWALPPSSLAIIVMAAAVTDSFASPPPARITQLANDVKLVPSHTSARPAAVNDAVPEGAVLRAGADSRVEVTFADGTLARLSPASTLRFAQGRTFELASGAILLHAPKTAGTATIATDLVSVSTAGATVALETLNMEPQSKSRANAVTHYRVSVLEGEVELRSGRAADSIKITAGQAALASTATPGAKVVKFDVADWMQRNALLADFRPLPATVLALIGSPSAGGAMFAALFRKNGMDAGGLSSPGFGTLNPSNLSGGGANEVSPSEERTTICHNGQTLTLPRDAAERHLRNHRDDSAGACR